MVALFENWQARPEVKTVVVGVLNVLASWAVVWIWKSVTAAVLKRKSVSSMGYRQLSGVGCRTSRRRARTVGEEAIEILEGLDEVGR